MENKKTDIHEEHQLYWSLLADKGISFSDRIKIRKAFSNWGKMFDDNIEYDSGLDVYSSRKRKAHGFKKESEVRLLHALSDISPESDTETLITVMSICMKLLSVESDYAFKSRK